MGPHAVRGQNIWGVHPGHALVNVTCLTARWPQNADEGGAVMRP